MARRTVSASVRNLITKVVRWLAGHGAKPDAKDKEERTPMPWAEGVFARGGLSIQQPRRQHQTMDLLRQFIQ